MNVLMQIEIDNLKCGGCENSIVRSLSSMAEVTELVVDRQRQTVSFRGEPSDRDVVAQKLRSLGYPEKGTMSGIDASLVNAKSFLSCAVGRMS